MVRHDPQHEVLVNQNATCGFTRIGGPTRASNRLPGLDAAAVHLALGRSRRPGKLRRGKLDLHHGERERREGKGGRSQVDLTYGIHIVGPHHVQSACHGCSLTRMMEIWTSRE